MNSVESALGCTQTATDALVRIDDTCTATQTTGRFHTHLFLGKCTVIVAEALGIHARIHRRRLTRRMIVTFNGNVRCVQLDKLATIAPDCHVTVLHVTVQAFRRFVSLGNCVDGEFRSRKHVAAHKDVGFRRLVGQLVRLRILAATHRFHLATLEKVAPLDCLPDGKHNLVRRHGNGVVYVVHGGKTLVFIVHRYALFEHHRRRNAVDVGQHLHRPPTAVDGYAVGFRFGNFLGASRHFVALFQAKHGHLACAASCRNTCGVNGNVSAADNHHLSVNLALHLSAVCVFQKLHRSCNVGRVFSLDAGQSAALATDGNVKRLVTLLTQLGNCHVLAHFHAEFDFHTHFPHDVDFGVDNFFVKLVARYTVGQHTACTLVLFKHGRIVAFLRKVKCATKPRRTSADNGNLLLPTSEIACNYNFRHETMFRIEVLFGNKLLYSVYTDGLIDCSASTSFFATTITNTSAYGRERIFPFDQLQRLTILAFTCLF